MKLKTLFEAGKSFEKDVLREMDIELARIENNQVRYSRHKSVLVGDFKRLRDKIAKLIENAD